MHRHAYYTKKIAHIFSQMSIVDLKKRFYHENIHFIQPLRYLLLDTHMVQVQPVLSRCTFVGLEGPTPTSFQVLHNISWSHVWTIVSSMSHV